MGEETPNQPPAGQPEEGQQFAPPGYTTPTKKQGSKSASHNLLEIILIVAAAVAVAWLIQAFLIKPFQIPTESMHPTLDPGDRLLVNRLAYSFGSVERGDVIVFKAPEHPDIDYVKRVIAVGGDTIEIKGGQVIVSGKPQVEPYMKSIDVSYYPEREVPEGKVFVMGDNRADSEDSRFWKDPFVPEEDILGKAFLIYWPMSRAGLIE